MLSETPWVLEVAIPSEWHRETTRIHLCERPFTLISNVPLYSRAGGALKYNLKILGFFLLEGKVPFKEFFDFLLKKGRDFTYCVYRGPWIQVGGGTGCLCAGSDPLMLLTKGWWEGTELGPFKASPLSCPDDAVHSGAEQGRVLPPLRRD